MEIKIRSSYSSKSINVESSIVSIQCDNNSIIDNLIKDYNSICIDNRNTFFLGSTVLEEIGLFNLYPELSIVSDAMKIMDLPSNFLDRKINTLSMTEKIYLNILRNISKLEEIIIFNNIFIGLDLNNQKKIIKLINYLKNNHVVFITSEDVNVLYKLSDFAIVSSKRTIKYDTCEKIYTNVKELIKLKLDVPVLSYITYKAKEEKNVTLFYRKDVRDTIKDIYKHV